MNNGLLITSDFSGYVKDSRGRKVLDVNATFWGGSGGGSMGGGCGSSGEIVKLYGLGEVRIKIGHGGIGGTSAMKDGEDGGDTTVNSVIAKGGSGGLAAGLCGLTYSLENGVRKVVSKSGGGAAGTKNGEKGRRGGVLLEWRE